MDLGIAGRRALVCAASKGLGRGCAEALAREGVDVTICARTEADVARTADEIGELAGRNRRVGRLRHHDARRPRAALAACPQPDILVNNAGGPPPGDFRDWDRDAWIRALDANMLTPIELIKATVDAMIERKFGRIVNITSSAVKAPIDILGLSNGARSGLTGFVAGARAQGRAPQRHDQQPAARPVRHRPAAREHRRRARRPRASRTKTCATRRWMRRRPAASAIRANSARSARSCAACTPATSSGRTSSPTAARIRERSDRRRLIPANDRPLLLDDAERPQDHDVPRGDRARLHAEAGQHLARRAVRARVPRDRAEQPHSGDRRPRAGDRGGPVSLFESGAILLYLADKTGRFIPADPRMRWQCIQWLFWQMAGLGPMAGQNHHFGSYARADSVRDRPLRQRDGAAVRGARPAAARTRIHRRRLLDRRHRVLSVDPAGAPAPEHRRLSGPCSAGRRRSPRVRRRSAPTRSRRPST